MQVRIESDGTGKNTTVADADGKAIDGAFGFRVEGSRREPKTTATIFCFGPKLSWKGDAEIVIAPPPLIDRAKRVAEQFHHHPAVLAAFAELLGVPFKKPEVE